MPRIEIEHVQEEDDLAERATENFDRIAFAERALELVRPPRTTVAICEGGARVNVVAGRQWGKGPGARWAVVSVPPDASRRAVATAILGLHGGAVRAWSLDVLMAACSERSDASHRVSNGASATESDTRRTDVFWQPPRRSRFGAA